MSDTDYQTLDEMLEHMDDPQRTACQRILADHRAIFQNTPGSTHNHQTWLGGYIDHVTDLLNIARVIYPTLHALRPLPFTLTDAQFILFQHDIEKPWKYEVGPDGQLQHRPHMDAKSDQHAWRLQFLERYGIKLTEMQLNALTYVEGELAHYSSRHRVMNELAAFCHMCDVCSARIWYNHPMESGDPWPGAARFRDILI